MDSGDRSPESRGEALSAPCVTKWGDRGLTPLDFGTDRERGDHRWPAFRELPLGGGRAGVQALEGAVSDCRPRGLVLAWVTPLP